MTLSKILRLFWPQLQKTFNIAGTKNSFAIIQNPDLRRKFQRVQLANNQHEVPTIGMITTETAFSYGKPWLEETEKSELKKIVEYLNRLPRRTH